VQKLEKNERMSCLKYGSATKNDRSEIVSATRPSASLLANIETFQHDNFYSPETGSKKENELIIREILNKCLRTI